MEGFSQEEKGTLVFHHFMQASAKLIKRPGEVFVDVMASVNVNALPHTLTYIHTDTCAQLHCQNRQKLHEAVQQIFECSVRL